MQKLDLNHPLVLIAKKAFPFYRGRKFKLSISSRPKRLLSYWDGGSKDSYIVIQDGVAIIPPTCAPFGREHAPEYVPQPNAILVEHSIFMGKDVGCTIYVHPDYPLT